MEVFQYEDVFMKKYVFAVALTATFLTAAGYGAVVVTGAAPNDSVIIGFNPPAPPQQDVVVAGPLASGIGGGFGFNSFNGAPSGFITMVDSNFVAIFTNQFGTNVVALPFTGTDLRPFAGRLPLGPLAPPQSPAAGNSAPGAAPAVPPQNFPPASVSPAVPQLGGVPPSVSPLPPTGRLAPIIPPTGTPTPSPTPIPPNSTPIP